MEDERGLVVSKIGEICTLLDGAHLMGDKQPLREYHAAEAARNALRVRMMGAKLEAVRLALKNYRVSVDFTTDGQILIMRFDGQTVVL
jgi:hypothetical protein